MLDRKQQPGVTPVMAGLVHLRKMMEREKGGGDNSFLRKYSSKCLPCLNPPKPTNSPLGSRLCLDFVPLLRRG